MPRVEDYSDTELSAMLSRHKQAEINTIRNWPAWANTLQRRQMILQSKNHRAIRQFKDWGAWATTDELKLLVLDSRCPAAFASIDWTAMVKDDQFIMRVIKSQSAVMRSRVSFEYWIRFLLTNGVNIQLNNLTRALTLTHQQKSTIYLMTRIPVAKFWSVLVKNKRIADIVESIPWYDVTLPWENRPALLKAGIINRRSSARALTVKKKTVRAEPLEFPGLPPSFRLSDEDREMICASNDGAAATVPSLFGFRYATPDGAQVLTDESVNMLSRHESDENDGISIFEREALLGRGHLFKIPNRNDSRSDENHSVYRELLCSLDGVCSEDDELSLDGDGHDSLHLRF